MPPRIVVGVIVAFWLTATGYLAYREWWPWFRADGPPPFTVELADEAAPQIAHWSIWRGNQQIGTASTRMSVLKDDTIELYSSIENLEIEMEIDTLIAGKIKAHFKVPKLVTIQNVTRREGHLISLDSTIQLVVTAFGQKFEMKAAVQGEARDGKLFARSSLESFLGNSKFDLDPIALESDSLFNPMQPNAKIRDLQLSRRWKITNVDPLYEALGQSFEKAIEERVGKINLKGLTGKSSKPRIILAEVLSEPRNLIHKDKTVSCYVIEYRSDDIAGSTWVQVGDGKVLRQEATRDGDTMLLLRED